MNLLYKKQTAIVLAFAAIASFTVFAQKAKVKTVTIINGDTTINERNIDDKELAKIEKEINIEINGDDDSIHSKKIVKKIIKNDKDLRDPETMAFAYRIDDGKEEDVEVVTDENGNETKIIVKKRKDEKEKSDTNEKRTIVKKSITSSDMKDKENFKLKIMVEKTNAKVEIETESKEQLNISILDENGKQVFYDTQKSGGKYSKEIPLEKKGTYFMNIIQNKKSTNEKIVIE